MNSNEENNLNNNENLETDISSNLNNENTLKNDLPNITDKKNQLEMSENYKFGWSNYSEVTNGRFAMVGFLAIILIELISKKSFLNWSGILN